MKSLVKPEKKPGKFPQLIQTTEGRVIAVSASGEMLNSFSSMKDAEQWKTLYQSSKQFSSTAGKGIVQPSDAMQIFLSRMKNSKNN